MINYFLKTSYIICQIWSGFGKNQRIFMLYYKYGNPGLEISDNELKDIIFDVLAKLGKKNKVLAIPPDFTRFHSKAGNITNFTWQYYGSKLTDILPACGTHCAMNGAEMTKMFGNIPEGLFREHNWRKDIVTLGHVPGDFIHEVSEGKLDYDWPAQVNRLLVDGKFDLILSIGQVVPHEVIGMANYNKNIFVGTGGLEGINKSHFLGAAYGMERIMGRADSPVSKVLNYASDHFGKQLPIVYIQTVVSRNESGKLALRGVFIGDDIECFNLASQLSQKVNLEMMDKPIKKAVVYLDPEEFKSTWLGNKSIYRTRMAIADNGELVVIAPGLKEFGEDKKIDALVRKYGYKGTENTLAMLKANDDLKENLSAAAHLIHGSSEGRFSITYCPGKLTKEEIEGVGFKYDDISSVTKKYDPEKLKDGFNTMPDGEEIFYISNPALGLWTHKDKFI
jgi:nickel-dependent lactate racemase